MENIVFMRTSDFLVVCFECETRLEVERKVAVMAKDESEVHMIHLMRCPNCGLRVILKEVGKVRQGATPYG